MGAHSGDRDHRNAHFLDEPPEDVCRMSADPRAVGDDWLRNSHAAVLRVPSVLAPAAARLLLIPRHPRAAETAVISTQPFRFDPRLWSGS